MTTVTTRHSLRDELKVGNRCLLRVVGDAFLVKIIDVQTAYIRVTFPGKDYPVEGMQVILDFHDENGFNSYRTHVVRAPDRAGALTLVRPVEARRTSHRDSCRVPTDLTVQVKDQVHIRRYDAALHNLSGGGALIETNANYDFSTTVEVTLSLPNEPRHTIIGQIVHVADSRHRGNGSKLYGIRFIALTPETTQSLARYIWKRLREVYPTEEK